jgi:hypothetical protein
MSGASLDSSSRSSDGEAEMTAAGWNAEKRFYEQNVILRQTPNAVLASAEQRWIEMHTTGDRYRCITDFLKHEGQLEAVEWGFGDPARCAALNRFFKKYIAIDICASTLVAKAGLDSKPSFSYTMIFHSPMKASTFRLP